MYVLEVSLTDWENLEDGVKSLVSSEKGMLTTLKSNGKREKVLTLLNLSSNPKETNVNGYWDMVVGYGYEILKVENENIKSGKLIQRVDFPGSGIEEPSVDDWWSSIDLVDGVDVIEVHLEDRYSNLRVMQRLCRKDPRVRLYGGVILDLPTLDLKVGRKDSKRSWGLYTNGVYDDLKPLGVDKLETLSRTEAIPKKKTNVGSRKGRAERVGKKPKLGVRSGGKITF